MLNKNRIGLYGIGTIIVLVIARAINTNNDIKKVISVAIVAIIVALFFHQQELFIANVKSIFRKIK